MPRKNQEKSIVGIRTIILRCVEVQLRTFCKLVSIWWNWIKAGKRTSHLHRNQKGKI